MASTSILPVETIEFEILPRLPVKSLLRFKSVCKSWNSLISSDVFIKSVRNSDHDSVTLISYSGKDKLYGHFTRSRYSVTLIGCMNGLVFIEEYKCRCSEILKFIIWNPATKQCLKIGTPGRLSSRYFLGFGFDSVANDYKLMYVIEEHPLVGYIYSCNSGCWTKIIQDNFVVPGYIMNRMEPVIINGSPFWLILQDLNKSHLHVMSFDVQQEFFRLLPDLGSSGPITDEEHGDQCYKLLNFRDSLAVMFCNSKFCFDETIDIHIFNEKCENWSKMSFGPFKFLNKVPTSCSMELRSLLCLSTGDILLVGSKVKELYWVNLGNYTIIKKGGDLCYAHNYSESLVFINGMKPLYQKEDLFRFISIKKDHGPAREEMQLKKKGKRKRSKRSPEERPRTCKRRKFKCIKSKGKRRSKRNRHDDEEERTF